jgi:biopolymer transport protein TolR
MGEINVVPLVDVVLVLLIVFMITAPLLYRGVDITLPKTETNTIKPEKRFVLTIATNRAVYINGEKIALAKLPGELQPLRGETVYLRADKNVPYGTVIRVIDMVKQAGIEQLGIVTAPFSGDPE